MEVNARASSLWRDVRNTFNLLSSRKQREEHHWNQPCNFCSVIIPVTTSDRADINSRLSYFFLLFFVFFFLQPQTWVAEANTRTRHKAVTERMLRDIRPVFQKAICNGSGASHLPKELWSLRLMTGDRERQSPREGVLLSISNFILLPVGMCTCVPACCVVCYYTHEPGLLCACVTHWRKSGLLGGRLTLSGLEKPCQDVTVLRTGYKRNMPESIACSNG